MPAAWSVVTTRQLPGKPQPRPSQQLDRAEPNRDGASACRPEYAGQAPRPVGNAPRIRRSFPGALQDTNGEPARSRAAGPQEFQSRLSRPIQEQTIAPPAVASG